MKKPQSSVDGFIPRRTASHLGERHPRKRVSSQSHNGLRRTSRAENTPVQGALRSSRQGLSRADIDESLQSIDAPAQGPQGSTSQSKRRLKRLDAKQKKIIKYAVIALVILGILVAGWVAVRTLIASNNIFKGNIFGLIQAQPLKKDASGRSNILLLGTSEDDPGHGGAYLTDSMMVVSIDQANKAVDMFSIPRDLYVKYGMACNSGYQGKINEYFNCVNDDWESPKAEEERLAESRKFVGDIFGMDIQYAVHVNNTVIKEAVDAVGGVDINIQGSNGEPGILDRNFDWRCNYDCYLVKYDNGVHHLDGKHALFLAMARGDSAPTYGLGNSNFDREKNQQKIIIALKEKAVSTGTLTDLGKVTGLIDALGNNLRTNFETSEIRTLAQLGTDIKTNNIRTISLFDGDTPLVESGNYGGASVVMPAAGVFDYSDIRSFLKKELSTDPVAREGARIVVLNGSGVAGVAQTEMDELTEAGFVVSAIDNAPEGTYAAAEIYQIGDGKSATKSKLARRYGVTIKTTTPPVAVAEGTNFVIIIGQADDSAN